MIGLKFTLDREIDTDTRCLYALSYITFHFGNYNKVLFKRRRFALRINNDEDFYNQPIYVYSTNDEKFLRKREEYIYGKRGK